MQGIRLARPAGDLVFDETLEHFKFIRIKPCEAANVAPVDLDEIGPALSDARGRGNPFCDFDWRGELLVVGESEGCQIAVEC